MCHAFERPRRQHGLNVSQEITGFDISSVAAENGERVVTEGESSREGQPCLN